MMSCYEQEVGLLPCPFCGQLPNVELTGQTLKIIAFDLDCDMHPIIRWRRVIRFSEQRVYDMWNTRAKVV